MRQRRCGQAVQVAAVRWRQQAGSGDRATAPPPRDLGRGLEKRATSAKLTQTEVVRSKPLFRPIIRMSVRQTHFGRRPFQARTADVSEKIQAGQVIPSCQEH